MTRIDSEAVLERAAIMEYDAGLDRKTATLSAYALYYPAEYQARIEKLSADPDRENILYKYLEEEFFKTSGTSISENSIIAKCSNTVSQKTRQGIDALLYMTGQGIPLIGVYQSGAMIAEQKPDNFTTDPAEILSLMEGRGDKAGRARGTKIRRFYHIPKDAGLLDLDIDRKPGKPDGLKEFYKAFPRNTLPKELQDIERYFPCWVATPSGGYHLYFKYDGELIKKTDLCPEVEVKHGRPGLTAPGSVNAEGKPYILHGNIADAPPLYWFLLNAITKPQKIETQRIAADKPAYIPSRKKEYPQAWKPRSPGLTTKQRIDLSVLADEACAKYSGHHGRQVCFAGKACRCKFSYSDALAYVKSNPQIFGNDVDTENTITSVYKDNGGTL